MKNKESEYIKKGWNNNVINCNIPIEKSVMICDDPFDYEYCIFDAGIILGELGMTSNDASLHFCGKWWWIEFKDNSSALSFKLKWV